MRFVSGGRSLRTLRVRASETPAYPGCRLDLRCRYGPQDAQSGAIGWEAFSFSFHRPANRCALHDTGGCAFVYNDKGNAPGKRDPTEKAPTGRDDRDDGTAVLSAVVHAGTAKVLSEIG